MPIRVRNRFLAPVNMPMQPPAAVPVSRADRIWAAIA
jgi:hypothetical protein